MIAEVEGELGGILGRGVELKLRLTATDSASVLDAVIPHYTLEGKNQIPAKRQGSGLVSLQHILLLLHFGRLRASQDKNFLMAMEEPELHVPPPLQRRLVHRIRSLSTQTIVVTHSPVVASACDPTTIRVLNNSAGSLSAKPLMSAVLTRTDPNWKRILYGVKRQDTLAALMHEVVLVPEGRIDFDLLTLMVNAEELRRPVPAGGLSQVEFGTIVGVVPTTDANVEGVFQELSKVHARVLCLVDGDPAGDGYVTTLKKLGSPPKRILQLPRNWTIEDVVGWIAEGDEANVVTELSSLLGTNFVKAVDVVAQMKKETKASGWKGDIVTYELIINTLADNPKSFVRMRTFLTSAAEACNKPGVTPSGWASTSGATAATSVIRFAP
jgi:putative ATP-dependent endonuclease of the OLD family